MKKILIVLYLIFCIGFLAVWMGEYRAISPNFRHIVLIFGSFFWVIYTTLFCAFYYAGKWGIENGRDLEKLLFTEEYQELKKKYGAPLKEIFVRLHVHRLITGRFGVRVKLSICQDVLFITDGVGKSLCMPYLQYPIRGKESFGGRALFVENIIPEEMLRRIFPKKYLNKGPRPLCFLDLPKKEFDFILSLVRQAREKSRSAVE